MESGELKKAILILEFLIFVPLLVSSGITDDQVKHEPSKKPKVVYPQKTDLDFEGLNLEGELRNPGEFYFQRRPEEKFDSLVKRRRNFHREILRDVVLSK